MRSRTLPRTCLGFDIGRDNYIVKHQYSQPISAIYLMDMLPENKLNLLNFLSRNNFVCPAISYEITDIYDIGTVNIAFP